VIHPTPPGTRDILPDEMRELRALQSALRSVFEEHRYGEVATPTIEYAEVLRRGDESYANAAYRFFDERGDLLAMRSDMTIPIARLVATRLQSEEPPFRLSYVARAYRAVNPQRGQMREFTQAGIELILTRLAEHDLVGLELAVGEVESLDAEAHATLLALPGMRGDAEVIDRAIELGGPPVERATQRLRDTYEALSARGISERIRLDLGLLRDLGYYTGAILEVYDPALGHIVGGGGRYDRLLERFGRDLPAAGFALYLERLHVAQAEEERLMRARSDDSRARNSATRDRSEERRV
jgi:ATP phosphoribosyltransferase regulatory subunit